MFSDPRTVSTYDTDDTTQYPFPQEMIGQLTGAVLSSELAILSQSSPDMLNDSADNKNMTLVKKQPQGQNVNK